MPYDMQLWYNCSDANFLTEVEGHVCSCHYDLCNNSRRITNVLSVHYRLVIVFILLLLK